MTINNELSIMDKLTILSDAAKYDVACTSSGVDKKNNGAGIGNSKACGICHTFAADGRCVSLLKILFTNECIFDCKYCYNRSSNDTVRTSFTPEEVCELTMEFYRRNYIEGLFLSSGIIKSPEYTMEQLLTTVMLLRTKYNFGGYIHLKGIPGAPEHLIDMAGYYVDRMSVNLELPTADGLKSLAPHKNRKNILTPMRQIQNSIKASKGILGIEDRSYMNNMMLPQTLGFIDDTANSTNSGLITISDSVPAYLTDPASKKSRLFSPAGQSTQMIIGATPENDYHIMTVAEALYKNYELKRVFYSAFVNVNQDSSLPVQESSADVPLLREHRLYQADWLLRFYGFKSNELLSEDKPNFNTLIDPKCDWALRHLGSFPVEINRADYYTLLRVPGIGVTSAKRIVKARKMAPLNFYDLKKIGVVLKRAVYFITCSGKQLHPFPINEDFITNQLISTEQKNVFDISEHNSYKQLSLFDDYKLTANS